MASVDFGGSRSERPRLTQTRREVPQRGRSGLRSALEIGASFSVLVLIAIGALAVRFLLLLPIGGLH